MAFLISSNGANCKKDWETLIYFNTRKKVYRANEDNKAYVNNFMKKKNSKSKSIKVSFNNSKWFIISNLGVKNIYIVHKNINNQFIFY